MIIESVKQGFYITHKNWQVILLRFAAGVVNLLGFIIIVGVPLVIAVISVGIDASQVSEMFPAMIDNPVEIVTRYAGIVILICAAFLVYLTLASIVLVYVYGGTLGVLRDSAVDEQFGFSYSLFFREAGRFFFPLIWLFSLALLIILALVVLFAVMAGIVFVLTQSAAGSDSVLSVFFSAFFPMLFIFLALALCLGSVVYITFASIALIVDDTGVMDSFRSAWSFVMNRPMAFIFYILLVIGMIAVNIFLAMIGLAFQMTPVIGPFTGIPYKIVYYAVQVYLGVVMWGALISYYMRGTGRLSHEPERPTTNDI